jgi:cytochrome c553
MTDKTNQLAMMITAMKKRLMLLFAMTAVVCLAGLACSQKKIDTDRVRAAFPNLAGEAKDYLDKGLKAIDESNYVAAIRPLKMLAYKVKMDKAQGAVLEDTIAKTEARAAKQK